MDGIRRIEAVPVTGRDGGSGIVPGVHKVGRRSADEQPDEQQGNTGNGAEQQGSEEEEHLEHGVPESLVPGIYDPRGRSSAAPSRAPVLPIPPATPMPPTDHIDISA